MSGLRDILSFQEHQVTGQRAHLVMSFSRGGMTLFVRSEFLWTEGQGSGQESELVTLGVAI